MDLLASCLERRRLIVATALLLALAGLGARLLAIVVSDLVSRFVQLRESIVEVRAGELS